jgi:ATP-dependent exoDNAse (exonuclease V) beta subunit
MAVLCRHHHEIGQCATALQRRRLPYQVRKTAGSYDPTADTIKVMTMHVSKGLEFPVVALAGVGGMPGPGNEESEEARLFYVAATRATHALYITLSGEGEFGRRLPNVRQASIAAVVSR